MFTIGVLVGIVGELRRLTEFSKSREFEGRAGPLPFGLGRRLTRGNRILQR